MKDSIRLGAIRGITIRLHFWVLALLAIVLLFFPGDAAGLLLYAALLTPMVLLHELGHALVAQHFGIRVLDITFMPWGGMARMSAIPEDGRVEGWIAVAGPLVNFGLGLLALPFALLPGEPGRIALLFAALSLFLGAFNLLPAFPMDGARVLRAWLGRKGDWLGATERAVRVGRFVAVLAIVGGFFLHPLLALVGVFVWWTGSQELLAVRLRHHGPPLWSFGPFRAFRPRDGRAAEPRAARSEPAEPVAGGAWDEPDGDDDDDSDEARARRPVQRAGPRARRWTDEELSKLERFPGSLRQFRSES